MIQLRDKGTGHVLGTITRAQLDFLIEHLEEESEDDRDYYLNSTTLDALAKKSTDAGFIGLLRAALGSRPDMEIEWSEP
jgi:hypothetical protein